MTTMTCPPAPVALHRSWLRRWLSDMAADWRAWREARAVEADYADLSHLSEQTLRDIGAPDWVHEEDRRFAVWRLDRGRY